MIYWIRKFAAILGTSCFFVLFFIGLAHGGTYSLDSILFALAKAIFGASLPWVVGIVIADILLKGVLSDIAGDQNALMEGGLMQRIHSLNETVAPGGASMPFAGVTAIGKKQDTAGRS